MADLAAAAEQLARAAQQAAQHQALGEVRDGMQRLETKLHSLEQLAIAQNLQWALKHGSCIPCPLNGYFSEQDRHLERDALQTFLRNKGWPIPDVPFMPTRFNHTAQRYEEPTDQDRQAFRDALVDRLTVLTGMKPRVVTEIDAQGHEQHVIYRA